MSKRNIIKYFIFIASSFFESDKYICGLKVLYDADDCSFCNAYIESQISKTDILISVETDENMGMVAQKCPFLLAGQCFYCSAGLLRHKDNLSFSEPE